MDDKELRNYLIIFKNSEDFKNKEIEYIVKSHNQQDITFEDILKTKEYFKVIMNKFKSLILIDCLKTKPTNDETHLANLIIAFTTVSNCVFIKCEDL